MAETLGDESQPVSKVEIIDTECFLIRNALCLSEQWTLFKYIQSKDKTPATKPAMVPSPKTLVLGDNGVPTLSFEFGEKSIINSLIEKANKLMREAKIPSKNNFQVYKGISMATIKYESPNQKLPPHVDHVHGFVYLMSLGCAANFMVKGPSQKKDFKFCSGDMLIFDSSTEAKILHGISSIDSTIKNEKLCKHFPVMDNHRFGVQCRIQL